MTCANCAVCRCPDVGRAIDCPAHVHGEAVKMIEANALLEKQLSEGEAARLRAERERDEALADAKFVHEANETALDAAQKRIEGLERYVQHRSDCAARPVAGSPLRHPCSCGLAALSSPAVTAEGKKLGEEGGGT